MHATFHLDPSNRLATVHERYRQDRQRSNSIGQTVLQTVALCYRTNVCACLATLVHCGQTVGWIKMPLGMKVNLGRPGHTVLDGDRVPPFPQQRGTATPQFSAHVCCSKTAGWTMIPYGMEIGLDLGDIIRWVPSSPLVKGHSSHPTFRPMLLWPNGRPSQQLLSCC